MYLRLQLKTLHYTSPHIALQYPHTHAIACEAQTSQRQPDIPSSNMSDQPTVRGRIRQKRVPATLLELLQISIQATRIINGFSTQLVRRVAPRQFPCRR